MFEVTFLGTAASTPSAERGLPAVLVQAAGERFLIDCGEGAQRQMLRAGSGFRRLGHVLLTHAHLDHVLGLAGLIPAPRPLDLPRELAVSRSAAAPPLAPRCPPGLWPQPPAARAARLPSPAPG